MTTKTEPKWETEFKAMLWNKDLKALIELLVETRSRLSRARLGSLYRFTANKGIKHHEAREMELIVEHMNDEFHILLNGKLFEGKNIP